MNEAELIAGWKKSIRTRQLRRSEKRDLRERGLLPKRVQQSVNYAFELEAKGEALKLKRLRREVKKTMKVRIAKRKTKKPLTCSDLCDKTFEFQGCPSGTCALHDRESTGRLSHLPEPL